MPVLPDSESRSRAAAARVARLATVSAAGEPHLVPVCLAIVDGTAYIAVDHKAKRSTELRRTANLLATGRASLLVDFYDEDWQRLWWVRLDGTGRVVEAPAELASARAALTAKYPQYREHPPDGPMLAVDVHRYRGWTAAAQMPAT
ncbi:TIGR03668 family PPOX class F420-dependent oxidoreductase [Jatrophihabitans lederbergiae]|uniref:TIGR03668 family PPOX class F420-dependent oxidoreductase n=1 Tax=Jatrophihabitans lederbergiae TaxID=3075547 RepID=A0ABU2J875_9ACTN|nr:TIGR03668 family PPOX class F420-dependent oxidoreductase [Jatrophihabitans sp. DSM 44399]MDT0261192.1 TIGR03668 family PPOX class F420-dependent oxidoreductase [Jatrophihabitans sp. DSM 44399]